MSDDYDAAFTESTPLVSFVIPTYDRFELLRDRSLPSILAQSYENLEVIVSGDDSPPEAAQVVEEIGDPRVRFINRSVRGPYPEDREERWLMSGTPPMNDGLAVAKGRWIAILGDDDEVTPRHTTALVAAAQERRLEHCYGRLVARFADGGELDWDSKFPPAYGHYSLQLAIYHAGLRFFQFEPGDVAYGEPNDWSLARRMAAAGVRFGKIDELVCIKYEDRPMPKIDPVDG
jgi:glycosyltransferase involved in cell wall biosynthesis